MPGLYGYFNAQVRGSQCLSNMRHAMDANESLQIDSQFSDDRIHAGRVHLGVIGERQSPYTEDGYYAWVEGEVYNLPQVLDDLDFPPCKFVLCGVSNGHAEGGSE